MKQRTNYKEVIKPPIGSTINWRHPMAKDLIAVWLFNEGAGAPVELMRRTRGTFTNYNSWRTGPRGKSLAWNDSMHLSYPDTYLKQPQVLSWACGLRRGGTVDSYARPFGKTFADGGSAPYVTYDFEVNPAGAGQNHALASIGTTTALHTTTAFDTGDLTIPRIFLGTYVAGTLKFYMNGILRSTNASVTGTVNYDTGADASFLISSASAAGVNQWNGDIYWIYIWQRCLNETEAMSLNLSPYQFINWRRKSYLFGEPPPAGGININQIERKIFRGVLRGVGRGQ